MKKLTLLIALIFIIGTARTYAVNPIPSFNTKITYRANFQELKGGNNNKEKRQMNVETTSSATPEMSQGTAIVYVYKLVGNEYLGPFYLDPGEVLTVDIDNSKWGVVMELEKPGTELYANVWIDASPKLLGEVQPDFLFPGLLPELCYYPQLWPANS
jgi:hypothetical protein